jgi:hypothetical protein
LNHGLRQGGTSTVKRRLASVAPGILIAALALPYWQMRMVPAVPRPDRTDRWSADLYESYLPVWTFAYAGPRLVPRWNPFQLAGSPLLASVTGAPAYPLNLLATVVPVPIALGWACALHVALAGLLMFLCGRAAGLTRAAATLAAIGFMLSERVLIERIHPPYLFGIAWLPAVFLAAGRVVYEPGAWRGAVLGVAVACLLLTGYPELLCFTAYSLLLLLLMFLVMRACHVATGSRAYRRAGAHRGRGGRAGVRRLAGERSGAGAPRLSDLFWSGWVSAWTATSARCIESTTCCAGCRSNPESTRCVSAMRPCVCASGRC